MQRYKIKIEYEGTPFVGWQFQKNGQSVQEVLQKAIFNFSKEKIVVTAAGRTDSGVHALAQVAHFDLKKKVKKKSLLPAINQNIGNKPVTVLKINKANKKFHARFDAKKRTYQYIIINRQFRHSKVLRLIDETDTAILNNTTTVTMAKKFTPTLSNINPFLIIACIPPPSFIDFFQIFFLKYCGLLLFFFP